MAQLGSVDRVAPDPKENQGGGVVNKVVGTKAARRGVRYWLLLLLSVTAMFVGFISASLLMRFYYSRGGSRKWLGCWVQTAGWPLCILAMLATHGWSSKKGPQGHCSNSSSGINSCGLARYNWKTSSCMVSIGCIVALDNFMYTWGMSYLPASTAGILTTSQLAFNSIFGLLLLKTRINACTLNSIVLVACSALVLGLHSGSDKVAGVTPSQTAIGYVVTIAAAGLYGLVLCLTELLFTRVVGGRSGMLVLQTQATTALVATLVSTVGMGINHDFQAVLYEEPAAFAAGKGAYVATLIVSVLAWQTAFLGTMGVVYLSSSLFAGIILTLVVPVGAIFAFIFFHDSFHGLKVVAIVLSVWAFASYVYGGGYAPQPSRHTTTATQQSTSEAV